MSGSKRANKYTGHQDGRANNYAKPNYLFIAAVSREHQPNKC